MERLLKNSTQIIALATAGVISFSIIHDYFYFSIVGKKFFSMMSTWDHISSALENTVSFLLVMFLSTVYRLTTSAEPIVNKTSKTLSFIFDQVIPVVGAGLVFGSMFLPAEATIYSSLGVLFMAPIWAWFFTSK